MSAPGTPKPEKATQQQTAEVAEIDSESSQNTQITWTDEEERILVRKIDLFLLPTIWLMYLLSYMASCILLLNPSADYFQDRSNIGNAKIAGMSDDLKLSSNQYSTALVVFFVTYVFFEAPSNMILVRWRPSLYLPTIMAIWGALTCCMAAINDFHHLVILRILVGVFESGFAPGILLIISSWYKKTEQSKRFAVYISAAVLSGAFGGLLAGAITGGLEGVHGIRGWKWLFIVEGAATIAWASIATLVLLDFPANSKRLTDRERQIAIARLKAHNVTVRSADSPQLGRRYSFVLAVVDWRTWLLILGYMVIVGSSTLSYFYPTLVHGLGYTSTVHAQYMTVPIYGVAFVCTLATGIFSDRIPNHRGVVISCWLTVSLITAIVVCTVYNYTVRYVMLVIMAAGLWSANGLSLSYASSTFGDMEAEVRAVALALVNCMGNLAQIYGSYLFPTEDKPKYLMGFGTISGLLAFGVCVYALMHVLMRRYKKVAPVV